MTTIQERVEAGAAWLDANRPGWVDRIELGEDFDMTNPCGCPLGQEWGNYYEAVRSLLDGSYARAVALGFDLGRDAVLDEWDTLAAAWRDYITARRAA